jgi:predicted dehydrogenase
VVLSNANTLVKEYGDEQIRAYQDWHAMLDREKLDIIVVATPNKYLKEITLNAAQKKIHILCEKPLGRNLADSVEMVEAAKKNKVFLKTGFNHCHHPAIWKAYAMVKEGTIGEIYYARCIYGHGGRPGYEKEWRANREICGGGELLDQGVHVVDLFRWFLGDFEEVFGTLSTYSWNMEVEDNAFALFKTAKGQTASMHTSWTQWKNRFSFEIYGEAGYLIVEGLGGSYGTETLRIGKRKLVNGYTLLVNKDGKDVNSYKLLVDKEQRSVYGYKLSVDTKNEKQSSSNGLITHQLITDNNVQNYTNQLITNNVVPRYAAGPPDEEVIEFPGPDISWGEEWKEFMAAMREGRETLGSGQDGLEANRMIEAVYRSARENRPIKIRDMK